MAEHCVLPFLTPTTIMLVSPQSGGKSTYVNNLIKSGVRMFDQPIVHIMYVYTQWQQLFDEMENTIPNIIFNKGIHNRQVIDER